MERSARRALGPLFLVVLVDIFGLTLILPLLPFYAEHFGATPSQVGLLVSTFALCQLVAGPILGQLSDRFGRRPLLLVSQAGTLVGFVLLARADSLWMVFVARAIDGLTAGNLSIAQAYISDVTEPHERSSAFAIIGVAFGLGFLVGPAVSGWLSHYGYTWPIWMAAAMSLLSILATALLLPESAHRAKGGDEGPEGPGGKRLPLFAWGGYFVWFGRPRLAALLLQYLAFCLAFASFTSGFGLFAERRFHWEGRPFTAREVGFVFAYAGLLGIVLQGGLMRRLVPRFGEPRLVVAGFLANGVGYALLGAATGVPLLLLSATISSFGNGVLRPVLVSLITQQVDRREQGAVLGLSQSIVSVAQIAAPLLAGLLIEHGQLTLWALVGSAISLGALALAGRAEAAGTAAPAR